MSLHTLPRETRFHPWPGFGDEPAASVSVPESSVASRVRSCRRRPPAALDPPYVPLAASTLGAGRTAASGGGSGLRLLLASASPALTA